MRLKSAAAPATVTPTIDRVPLEKSGKVIMRLRCKPGYLYKSIYATFGGKAW
jgi:hypothetical protein